jgi:hypothetical protein
VGKYINSLVLWVFVVVQARAVRNVSIREVELNHVLSFELVEWDHDPVSVKLDTHCRFAIDKEVGDGSALKVKVNIMGA